MGERPEPVLVYTRIVANVRKTRLLMASFAAVLMPVVSAATVFAMPWASILMTVVASAVWGPGELARRFDFIVAELDAARPAGGLMRLQDLPSSVLWLIGGLLALALAMVAIGFAVVTLSLVSRYGSRVLLRAAHARPVVADEERDLTRIVENLCIGAGLPMPSLYIIESSSPNAFATGRDPERASLVVTRGLLALVDRRELQGVIAHELSHIGNHDTRLTTFLAALVGAATIPWRFCLAPVRFAFRIHRGVGVLASIFGGYIGLLLLIGAWFTVTALSGDAVFEELPAIMWWWSAHAVLTPLYALFVAPVAALIIRQAVSREREFLADADAVRLTRDPEGLALALVKIGAAHGERLRVGEGSVHLYLVDPRGSRSVLHKIFPSHPPLEDRLELLANMGSGIPRAALETAIEAGKRLRHSPVIEPPVTMPKPLEAETLSPNDAPMIAELHTASGLNDDSASPPRSLIPLYEQPDGWSKVLAHLDETAVVTPLGRQGKFVRVRTADNILGYVSASARLRALREVVNLPEAQHLS